MASVSSKRKYLILFIILAVIGAAAGYHFLTLGQERTDDATIETHVVTVAPKVSGYIISLKVQDNQSVKAGDVLAEIDPSDYQLAVDLATANLDAAKAKLEAAGQNYEATQVSAPSNLEAAKAQVKSAQATWENAHKSLMRLQRLSDMARSKQQLDDAIALDHESEAALNDAKARLATAQTAPQTIAASAANMDELQASVDGAKAALEQAKLDLVHTKIIAPIDGVVTNRGVEVGNFVSVGQNLGSIVSPDFWVVANFKETQLTDMKEGQKVTIEMDAYPSLEISGHVDSIQRGTGARFSAFPPQNATGNFVKIVQRVPVKILVDGTNARSLPIGPGMSVVPTVYTR